MTEFRKKLFRGAKVEDLIHDLDDLSQSCERTAIQADDPLKRRFYEGMSVAYYLVSQKLKGRFEYVEEEVVNHLYTGMQRAEALRASAEQAQRTPAGGRVCSFCGRGMDEVGPLAPGPGVAICGPCAEFAKEVIAHGNDARV
ncbi:ClpX C4-type zinc finger protein [Alicyclobacillus macrosporangiidus]|uniref:ClpX C4-type zinc finger n=1 Tax=Alicyclobacillus macrosporangiidus TaxID=392015 RepID=A0A1I7HF35_9BACL|nr:ClpX C4-type zinc finger protein [Alicyclobacillus macrosporangiidus]SFU59251.1 ClpX C4-type zinc finger [Alicyclobacillus macrosporangiidus]